jgi:hypothetical protein
MSVWCFIGGDRYRAGAPDVSSSLNRITCGYQSSTNLYCFFTGFGVSEAAPAFEISILVLRELIIEGRWARMDMSMCTAQRTTSFVRCVGR